MSLVLILAEKPKQAIAYAEAFKSYTRKDGYIEIKPNDIFPDGAYLTWAFGHLIELAKPSHYKEEWSKWDLANLPIKPEEFIYLVSAGKEKQYKIISDLMRQSSELIVATDCDREGENIAWSIINQAKIKDKPIKRLWINSLEEEVVINGFRNLRNGKDYYNSYIEAQTRQISDWLVGMNASQLYTLLLQQKGINESFSVGRVQTPTLYLIHQREKEMESFVQTPFYELNIAVNHPNGPFTAKAEGRYLSKEEANSKLEKAQLKINEKYLNEIAKVQTTLEKEPSPRLYTMSGIQTKANKLWKYSPAKVLELVQGLYEKKLLTYPRTDTPYITLNEFSYLKNNLSEYQKLLQVEFPCIQSEPQKRYIDSNKVQEHYAIIPTKNVPSEKTVNDLSQEEQNIYREVVMNTISMFHAPYQYEKTVIEIHFQDLLFKATGKVEVLKGWKELQAARENDKKEEVLNLPKVNEGDAIQFSPNLKEGKTTKPKRFTEGDLIPLMKHSGNQLDEDEQEILKETEGIGTEATRANIIETLKNQKYIDVRKNLVYTTSKGVILCESVEGTLLASASLTAKWESFLKLIGKGERSQKTFLDGIYQFIDRLMKDVPNQLESDLIKSSIEQTINAKHLGSCPTCEKGYIVEHDSFYGCTGHSEGCKQTLPKKMLGKTISETQVKKLLEKGKTDVIKGFKGRKTFDSFLTFELDDSKKVKKFKFNFK